MNTTENNKLIAEFMEFQQTNIGWYDAEEVLLRTEKDNTFDDLKFHTDWNWLMQVVEKIENTKYDNLTFDVFISKNKTHIHYSANNEWFSNIFLYEGKTKIENTYNACVEFIKWYNENSR